MSDPSERPAPMSTERLARIRASQDGVVQPDATTGFLLAEIDRLAAEHADGSNLSHAEASRIFIEARDLRERAEKAEADLEAAGAGEAALLKVFARVQASAPAFSGEIPRSVGLRIAVGYQEWVALERAMESLAARPAPAE